MNFLSLISVLLFLLYFQLGIIVYLRNRKSGVNISFFILSLCFAIWSFGYILVYSAPTAYEAWYWDNVASLGYTLFPAAMVAFLLFISELKISQLNYRAILAILSLTGLVLYLAILLGWWSSSDIVQGPYAWHFVPDLQSPFYLAYYVYVLASVIIAYYALFSWNSRLQEKHGKTHFYIVLGSLSVFIFLGITFDLLLPAMNIRGVPNVGHITALPWIAGVGFSIIRYQLLSNAGFLMAEHAIREIREVMIFTGNDCKILRINRFSARLLDPVNTKPQGKDLSAFFENQALLNGYLIKSRNKKLVGPVGCTLVNTAGELIETSLHFMSIKDRFGDIKGFIVYGQDNREALNLQKEIIVRQQAEKNLRSISEVLEIRVQERTRELAKSYKELQVKMTERMQVEEQIKADISEKEVLINEIHNRVKNNMNIIISLINSQDKKNLTPFAAQKFKELAQRVKSLLLVHQNLYLSITYSDVDFPNFLRALSAELLRFYKKEDRVEIQLDLSDVFLDVDYAIPLGTIINELLSNSLQHAFSPYYLKKYPDKKHMISLRYQYNNGYYDVSVADNGKGLPANFNISELQTNGLPLTEILVTDQINGKLDILPSDEGTIVKVAFLAAK